MKKYIYAPWYSDYINRQSGIWIGNGFSNQTLISRDYSVRGIENNCGDSYGYVVQNGIPVLIKLIGIEEEKSNE